MIFYFCKNTFSTVVVMPSFCKTNVVLFNVSEVLSILINKINSYVLFYELLFALGHMLQLVKNLFDLKNTHRLDLLMECDIE